MLTGRKGDYLGKTSRFVVRVRQILEITRSNLQEGLPEMSALPRYADE